jgi:hypothetical protein
MNCPSAVFAIVGSVVLASATSAQEPARAAEALVPRGMLERAESTYYAASDARPRDPVARWNLGVYLVARGATRVGMTLIEEAMQFGYDKTRAAEALAPIYLDLGEYHKLLVLSGTPLGEAERMRVRYLDAHPSRTIAPDTNVVAAYTPNAPGTSSGSATSLATVPIRIDGRVVNAEIVADGTGIVIAEGAVARRLHVFATRNATPATVGMRATPAVADSIGISRLVVTNVPIVVERLPAGVEARVGLAFLSRYTPSFDPRARRVVLHVSGVRAAPPPTAISLATLDIGGRLVVLEDGRWVSVGDPTVLKLLAERPWTLDARHGRLIVDR